MERGTDATKNMLETQYKMIEILKEDIAIRVKNAELVYIGG